MTKLPERNLDVLRAVAVLCVVALHASMVYYDAHTPYWLGALGHVGVLLFFVHTSLVLMSSLERSRLQRHEDWVQAFYVRRGFRIYPLAIASILAALVFSWPQSINAYAISHPELYRNPAGIVANLLLVQNLTYHENVIIVLWSLPIEVQMYALLPFAFLLTSRVRDVVRWLGVAVVLGMVVAYLQLPGAGRLSLFLYAPCFMAGVLAFALLRRGSLVTAHGWLVALASVVATGTALLALTPLTGAGDWAFCLAVGLLIPQFREIGESVVSRGAHVVAKYSYGVYLLHIPALYLTMLRFPNLPLPLRIASFPIVLGGMAWLAFHVIESPGIRLGQIITHTRLPKALERAPVP